MNNVAFNSGVDYPRRGKRAKLPRMKEWQISLKNAVSDPVQLFELLGLRYVAESNVAIRQFPLRVPHEFIARMEKGNLQDPLLLQVLPQAQEMLEKPGFVSDPLNEKEYNPVPGLLHKYQGRVLLTLQGACAVNCRYCFRRNFPYEDNMPGTAQWGQILKYIANDKSIEEVIFSGGDPLIMKDQQLGSFVKSLDEIKHLAILRIHTRLPIMIPSRINEEFLAWMNASRLQKIMAIHCNHPKEIDESVIKALARLRENNVMLLNQSVLLKNINDNAEILAELSKTLFKANVLPYYLHVLDPVAGSEHFNVDISSAKKIINEMRSCLPGYLVPKLVQEIPGEKSKIGL
jgi:EF-P beta-lysylation protein EpmB